MGKVQVLTKKATINILIFFEHHPYLYASKIVFVHIKWMINCSACTIFNLN